MFDFVEGKREAFQADRAQKIRTCVTAGTVLLVALLTIIALLVNRTEPVREEWMSLGKETHTTATAVSLQEKGSASELTTMPPKVKNAPYDITLCFAGDVSLADGSVPQQSYQSNGISCIGDTMLEHMTGADLFCLNSEFSFTTRGTRIDKNYNFRADPARISVYDKFGVDLAILANNHVFDYGEVGLQDTLDTFKEHGLPYVGAGENLDEASAIYYTEINGCKVAVIAGSRIEWSEETRGATEEKSGVFRTAESNDLMCQRIAEAKENADFVIVYIHWGIENVEWQEDYQLTSGKAFIDAGADVIVGDHPHVVQGIEWYNNKPIFYSLGNFWFSSYSRYTMLLEMELTRTDAGETGVEYRLVPGWTEGGKTSEISSDSSRNKFFNYMTDISVNASIDENGVVTEKT